MVVPPVLLFSPAPPAPEVPPLSLHDALPISLRADLVAIGVPWLAGIAGGPAVALLGRRLLGATARPPAIDRKSTRLNSSHLGSSYAVFCLKKKEPSLPELAQQPDDQSICVHA